MDILLTGATSGIGETACRYFSENGNRVFMVARSAEKLHALESEIGRNVMGYAFDLCNLSEINTIFECAQENAFKFDALFHCAGINRDLPVRSNDIEQMQQVTTTNYMSFIELMHCFGSKKYSNDGASVVVMSSDAVYACDKGMCTYVGSKAAVDAAVRVMAKEYARRRIRINSIQPTYVDTDMARATMDYEAKYQALPLGVIPPIEVVYLAEYLMSDKAFHISGSNIKMSSAAN